MVQQTKDSSFTEYGLAHAESGLSTLDKQLSLSLASRKSNLQDSRDESPIAVSKSVGGPFLMKDGESAAEFVKISGTKRPISESRWSPSKSNAGSGHIVYVRRRPETDLAKSKVCDTQSDAVDCSRLKKSTDQGVTTQQLKEMNEPVNCISDVAPLRRASSPSFSSTRRSVFPSLGISSAISSPENTEHVHVDCGNPSSEDPMKGNVKLWEEHYGRLQSLLKMLDDSNQYEYDHMLRSLSSVELSRHAIELQKRSTKLSLEEAKEMQRVRFIGVLGKHEKNVCIHMTQQELLRR